MNNLETLSEDNFTYALNVLAANDPDLDYILNTFGLPPLWLREPGFATLIQIILEQQVSLASAKAVFERLQAKISPITPEKFFQLDHTELKTIGFSRQKAIYGSLLAESIIAGQLDLDILNTMSDEDIRNVLKQLKGIGDWTVDIYLLMALRRPDALPKGDLGLILAIQKVKKIAQRPTPQEIEIIAENWRPWRAVATRLLWHYYLSERSPQSRKNSPGSSP
ncbi:MAG: DNA-3-methyladenine glycosylase 2 family protein [Pelatocladus maniniholoensis HA4357-MV3]|jgi:DNA-3-methyladenine glycosylase II|uniref:DNA-3-methyladenine glycosylase II n=1 Tax=Pelatocladus maniniholoensis HA4357-MV3 TaxID=1117104 RepID=A0A9E3HE45_9NOST|nr:DNA-3-methyladenine glycosylase 2 family protein [Pelatocladus maniniholoensis HA4357-MV3]